MSTARSQPFVPLEDFLEMTPEDGVRLEWCAGLVFAMSGGSPEHSRLCANVIRILPAHGDCSVFDSNADIWVEAAQWYGRADASMICGALHTHTVKKQGKTLGEAITNPVVIVEVMSPSSEERDRGEKFSAYKQISSLQEYVLVSQDERRVEIRRRGDRGWSTEVATAGGTIEIQGTPVSIDALYG